MEKNELMRLISAAVEPAISLRRELHEWPELGNREYRTAAIIERTLNELGIRGTYLLPTGISAEIRGERDGADRKAIAIRTEMDGFPIEEKINLPFSSKRFGYMHTCGHDVHMAVTLGVAMVLNEIKNLINIDVKLIFQPDEENEGGAKNMIEKGCLLLKDRPVDMILGMHVKPDLPAGFIALKYGKVHAESIMVKVKVLGEKGHGAEPHRSVDAITGAAQIISAVQLIISRELDPLSSGVITFGKIKGGEARNSIADEVILEGIIRGEDKDGCDFLKKRLECVINGISDALRVRAEIEFKDGYPALINDDSIVNQIRGAVKKYSDIRIQEIEKHSMTVDDFAYYLDEVPGAYVFLGSAYPGRKSSGVHTGTFEVNEDCIRTGIEMLTLAILSQDSGFQIEKS